MGGARAPVEGSGDHGVIVDHRELVVQLVQMPVVDCRFRGGGLSRAESGAKRSEWRSEKGSYGLASVAGAGRPDRSIGLDLEEPSDLADEQWQHCDPSADRWGGSADLPIRTVG